MPNMDIAAPRMEGSIDRCMLGAFDNAVASTPSNWWSGMAGVPFAESAEE